MDELRKKTEIKLIALAFFLVIAGISAVFFLFVSLNFISFENDWSRVLLVYFVIIAPMVFWILFPALLGEPFFSEPGKNGTIRLSVKSSLTSLFNSHLTGVLIRSVC